MHPAAGRESGPLPVGAISPPSLDAPLPRAFARAGLQRKIIDVRLPVTNPFVMLKRRATKRKVTRKILVILSNRVNRTQPPRHLELLSDEDGNILKETRLRGAPTKPIYDEVWENDEGRTEFASCFRFNRKYGHKLQKPK